MSSIHVIHALLFSVDSFFNVMVIVCGSLNVYGNVGQNREITNKTRLSEAVHRYSPISPLPRCPAKHRPPPLFY